MLKFHVEIIIYMRRVRVIYTRRGMPRYDTAWYYTRCGYCFYIHRPPAEIYRNQLLGVCRYTGNCITRGMQVRIATGIVRSQLLRRYVQPEPICQPSGHALQQYR